MVAGRYTPRDLLRRSSGTPVSLGTDIGSSSWVPVHVLAPMQMYVLELRRSR
jgi:hypothetical protein